MDGIGSRGQAHFGKGGVPKRNAVGEGVPDRVGTASRKLRGRKKAPRSMKGLSSGMRIA
jgi:hypothetical protein